MKKQRFSPHDLLPLKRPSEEEFKDQPLFFYENVAKPLIADTIRIMNNGLPIDLGRVRELERTIDDILVDVKIRIDNNTFIKNFLTEKYPKVAQQIKDEISSKLREPSYWDRPFKVSDPIHRSYFMLEFCRDKFDIITPLEEVYTDVPKWSAKEVKQLSKTYKELSFFHDKKAKIDMIMAAQAMKTYTQHRAEIYNKAYLQQIAEIKFETTMESFNPASAPQKQEFFKFLDVEPIEFSKDTGLPSWGRKVIEQLVAVEQDEELKALYYAFIDYSFAAIIKQNFIESFYTYTVDGRLYGNYRLLGAKSGRYTSNNPNMLNSPSTGSIYAKPIKRCFIAPKGYLVWGIDFAALEDRVIASLSEDYNKCALFLQNLDGHSMGAVAYFPDEIKSQMILTGNTAEDAKVFKQLVDEGNKVLKELRQRGKGITFGLSYGAYPPKVAKQLKCDMSVAEGIFNNYHNVLYPGITQYREGYVLKTAKKQKRVHLGMGFYIATDKPEKDIRTINNATCQFWSILTALAINKLHARIDHCLLNSKDIQVTSTIYDSIYGIVVDDPEVIHWLNKEIVSIMETDFMVGQTIRNEAELEIGLDWASLKKLERNATLEETEALIKEIYGKTS